MSSGVLVLTGCSASGGITCYLLLRLFRHSRYRTFLAMVLACAVNTVVWLGVILVGARIIAAEVDQEFRSYGPVDESYVNSDSPDVLTPLAFILGAGSIAGCMPSLWVFNRQYRRQNEDFRD
jgi:hypothetical protein